MSTVDAENGVDNTYKEEHVVSDNFENNGAQGEGKKVYDEEEYLAEVGELNCYCVPTRVYGIKDFMFRTLAWLLLNKEQILGGLTGKLASVNYIPFVFFPSSCF